MSLATRLILLLAIAVPLLADSQLLVTKSFGTTLQKEATWKVVDYEENIFRGWTLDQARSILAQSSSRIPIEHLVISDTKEENSISLLPDAYDFRKDFPLCNYPIRDQGKCGSCWAMGSVECLSARFCRAGKRVILSAQEIVSCCTDAKGCGGGYLDHAFDYFEEQGVVTEQCMPYESQNGKEPTCIHKCKNATEPYVKYKCKKGTGKYLTNDFEKLKTEMYNNGPIAASFVVYRDFYYYKSGVYKHTTGEFLGIHAVEAVGWGKENDVSYWIIANSWAADWGENGYFRIKYDDCGISKGMIACAPLLA